MAAMELLSPAGSMEALRAAVQNGADAVYLGGGDFNARKGAQNFDDNELERAFEYCHVRGCKVYVTLNTLLSDRELVHAAEFVRRIHTLGADAAIVQDLGVARMIRMAAPGLALHASTQMTVHNLEGVKKLASLGFTRVILARELGKYQIAYICKSSPLEVEVFAHGALCMCFSGQCYMSAVIGRRSGNRGVCAQPCRLPYVFGSSMNEQESYPLSLKDLSLAGHITELEHAGVKCLKIEGRMRRPEYVAAVTGVFSRALKNGREPGNDDMKRLASIFSRQGFTDGYYEGEKGRSMFGIREEAGEAALREYHRHLSEMQDTYREGRELQRVPVVFFFIMQREQPAKLAVEDHDGNRLGEEGPVPEPARTRATVETDIRAQLQKTGGTPYYTEKIHIRAEEGLSLSAGEINGMRRTLLEKLSEVRACPKKIVPGEYRSGYSLLNSKEKPLFTVSAHNTAQLTQEVLALQPAFVYLPIAELAENTELIERLKDRSIPLYGTLPTIVTDDQARKVMAYLDRCSAAGMKGVLTGNLGLLSYAAARGLDIRGDYGFNVFNSQALREVKRLGVSSATLSFELSLPQIRDISKNLDTEVIIYGRLPLMITENCIIKNRYGACGYCNNPQTITDRSGEVFPVVKEFGCRSRVFNAHKLFLADKLSDFHQIGVTCLRLSFTTENPRECSSVADSHAGRGSYEPQSITRGLYYRGVQ